MHRLLSVLLAACATTVATLLASAPALAQFVIQPLTQPNHEFQRPGRVDALVRLADGRYLVGGLFDRMGGQTVNGTVRLQLDGAIDPGFVSEIANAVDFAFDSQGRLYVTNGSRLVRLLSDGRIDATFPAVVPNSGAISRIEIDADQLIAAGSFLSLNGTPRTRLARIGTDGVVDPTWPATTDYVVNDLLAPGDGFVYVAGSGTNLGGASRVAIGRLAVAGGGTADAWNPILGGTVRQVARVTADAQGLFIAGEFTSVNGVARTNLARIGRDAAATVDPGFTTALSGAVGMARTVGDHLYLASASARLTATQGPTSVQRRLLRLDRTTGALDTAWDPLTDTSNAEIGIAVSVVAPGDGAGRVLVGGNFARLSDGDVRLGLAPLDATGRLDPLVATPEAATAGLLQSIQVDSDGAAYVFGQFERVNGAARRNLVRLAPSGSVDGGFRPPPVELSAAALHPGQAVYIADRDTSSVRRLHPATGDLLPGFSIPYSQVVGALEVVGPHLYWYGSFQITSVTPTLSGYARMTLATGTIDTAFRPNRVGSVGRTLFDAASDSLFLVGSFTSMEGQARTGLARYSASTLAFDASWNPVLNVTSNLTAAPDGTGGLYIGGNFATVNGQPCRGPARLKIDGSGTLDIGFPCDRPSNFAQTVAYADGRVYGAALNQPLRRFLPQSGGAIDPDWSSPVDSTVSDFAFDATRVFVLGGFNQIGGQPRRRLAALPVIDPLFRDDFESP